jgi:hypothetical protein
LIPFQCNNALNPASTHAPELLLHQENAEMSAISLQRGYGSLDARGSGTLVKASRSFMSLRLPQAVPAGPVCPAGCSLA